MKYVFVILLTLLFSCTKNKAAVATNSKLSIDDVTLAEGNTGQTNFEFKLTLDHSSSTPVVVTYSTAEGTAKNVTDITGIINQTITFQPGETEKKITILIVADDIKEGDEQFTVVISNATNAVPEKSSGVGTILNDDTKVPFTNAGYNAPTSYPGYTLTWSDEFNSGALNSTSWANQNGDGCPALCGWGNNELEYYTERPDNLFFQDGKLIIEAKKESFGGKFYTSSKIITAGKKTFKYGRIDIRAILPAGKGTWPAFWLLPQNNVYGGWPKSGEIDMMEMVGHEPNKIYGTMHYGPGPGSTNISRGYTLPSGNFSDSFHVFSIEWKPDQVKFYVDGNLYSTINKIDIGGNTWPFNEDFFLIFNFAVGGSWPGNPDASTYFPQWLIVDYIRVYQ